MRKINLTVSKVNKCFAGQTEQADVLIALYKLLYGKRWDDIETIDGWPQAGIEIHQYIGECFIRFDKAYHSEVLPGGLWMNRGWSVSRDLAPWAVKPAPYTLAE